VKRLDYDRYTIKVTPRKPTSKWSDSNRRRWNELKSDGLLAAPRAWQYFQSLAPTDRRDFVAWIHTAKRSETRERRIRESIELLAAGKKLGLK